MKNLFQIIIYLRQWRLKYKIFKLSVLYSRDSAQDLLFHFIKVDFQTLYMSYERIFHIRTIDSKWHVAILFQSAITYLSLITAKLNLYMKSEIYYHLSMWIINFLFVFMALVVIVHKSMWYCHWIIDFVFCYKLGIRAHIFNCDFTEEFSFAF